MQLKHYLTTLGLACLFLLSSLSPVLAVEGQVLGIHILQPSELDKASELLKTGSQTETWHYVTIPLGLQDLDRQDEWQNSFRKMKEARLIPIVRLVTRFENGAWKVPTKRDIVRLALFMNKLEWPTEQRHVIIFNEPNHAKEWGGRVDPAGYVDAFMFTSQWLHSDQHGYVVLPAGLDLAAPNGGSTMEAFTYLKHMEEAEPNWLAQVDVWNSHSYPNPGFSSAPTRTGKNSLRGFQYELAYLKEKTGREFDVFITETGWSDNYATGRWLSSYYAYARQHIWSDPRVKVVTPFILVGAPGPFASFSFLDAGGSPTRQYAAYQQQIEFLNKQVQ